MKRNEMWFELFKLALISGSSKYSDTASRYADEALEEYEKRFGKKKKLMFKVVIDDDGYPSIKEV